MRRRGRNFTLGPGVLVLLCGALLAPAAAMGSTSYMSCGTPPTYDPSLELSFEGQIHYAIHPSHCVWSDNGFTYRLVDLVGLHWRQWGKRHALARGKIVDNHDMDNNGFQRHPVRVVASDPRPAVGHTGTKRAYYTRLRVIASEPGARPFTEKLFRLGEQPVVPQDG